MRTQIQHLQDKLKEKDDALVAHKKQLVSEKTRADKMADIALNSEQQRAKDALERALSAELNSFTAVNPNGMRAGDLGDLANPLNIRDAQPPTKPKMVAQSTTVEKNNERAELPVNPFLQAQPQTRPSALKMTADAEKKPKKGAYSGNPRGTMVPASGQQDDGSQQLSTQKPLSSLKTLTKSSR